MTILTRPGARDPRPFRHKTNGPAVKQHPDAKPTGLPAEPCFKCGARGWCDHRGPW